MYSSSTTTLRGLCFLADLGRGGPLRGVCIGFILIQLVYAIGIEGIICHILLDNRLAPEICLCFWGFLRGFCWGSIRATLRIIMRAQEAHCRAIVWHVCRRMFVWGVRIGGRSCRIPRWASIGGQRPIHGCLRQMRSRSGGFVDISSHSPIIDAPENCTALLEISWL